MDLTNLTVNTEPTRLAESVTKPFAMTFHTPPSPLVGEPEVIEMGRIATQSITTLQDNAWRAFKLLWGDEESRKAKLALMGNQAALAFDQHLDTVMFLLRAHVRSLMGEVELSPDEFAALKADTLKWFMGNPEHPMSVAVFRKMPSETFTAPVEFTIQPDGSVVLK